MTGLMLENCKGVRHPRRRARVSAFTLVELLVVVSIIALLIAILLPSLRRARDQAKATVCLSNLKQVGNAIAYYGTDYPGTLPPYVISRRINSNLADHTNTPYWFQYLPFMYLSNHVGVGQCPADKFENIEKPGGTRGPYNDLQAFRPVVYYSYAMNPNQPKKAAPLYANTSEGKLAIVPEVVPYSADSVVERFNPGIISGLKQAGAFALLLETAGTGLLNPTSPFKLFRLQHGGDHKSMNLIFGDTHAEPVNIHNIYPGDFTRDPPKVVEQAGKWDAKFRALWYGDAKATGPRWY